MSAFRLTLVLCDDPRCNHEVSHIGRSTAAGRVMARRMGWRCDDKGDWCPDHLCASRTPRSNGCGRNSRHLIEAPHQAAPLIGPTRKRTMAEEPLTTANALDILRSWSWLYEGLRRSPVEEGEEPTDRWVREGAALGRNRQCSIGYHEECSDRSGINHNGDCDCPCHQAEWSRIATFMQWMDECLTHLSEIDPDDQEVAITLRPAVRAVEENPT